MASLGKMIYKGFKFPANPRTSGFECDRSYVRHKYPELSGNELEDFGPNAVIITGNGEFYGHNAYSNWDRLLAEFNKGGVGKIYHPIYKTITRGLMVKLKSDLEPRDNYIQYSFEIVADSEPNTSKDDTVVETMSVSTDTGNMDIGDIVNFTGNMHYVSSSSGAKGYSCKPGRARITNISESGAHKYHLIKINGGGSTVYGWVNASDINLKVTSTSDDRRRITHVIRDGECLSRICANYAKKYSMNVDWKEVARYNKIKDPNSIRAGQKIIIIL